MDVIVIISIVFATYSRMLEHTTTVYLMRVVFSDVWENEIAFVQHVEEIYLQHLMSEEMNEKHHY